MSDRISSRYYSRRGRLGEGLVNALDQLRVDRHEAIYGLEVSVEEEQARNALQKAKEFIRVAEETASRPKVPSVEARFQGKKWGKGAFSGCRGSNLCRLGFRC